MGFRVQAASIDAVKVVVPDVYRDDRGWFSESYRDDMFAALGLPIEVVQFNRSRSLRHVIRGLHFQWSPPMGKLVTVSRGQAFLVAVDIRIGSPTFARWYGMTVDAEEPHMIWAPASFARGWCALSDIAEIEYLCTGVYNQRSEAAIRWNDPEIGIAWPTATPILSPKDREAPSLQDWLQRPESLEFSFEAVA